MRVKLIVIGEPFRQGEDDGFAIRNGFTET
jgi:hypothetical protein